MKKSNLPREELLRALTKEVQKLSSQLAREKSLSVEQPLILSIAKAQKRFSRIKNPLGKDEGIGEFFMLLSLTPTHDTVYIPISITSSKKPSGFIYQIEGSSPSSLSATKIEASGTGVTVVTLGTIRYAKIPKGATASFRIQIEIRGFMQESYGITITRLNYKLEPGAARYQKLDTSLQTGSIMFH